MPDANLSSPVARAVTTQPPIQFIDLGAQRRRIGPRMDEAILSVVHSGQYIMGPQVHELERQLAAFCGAKHVLSCSSGTDALALYLMARGVRPGDAVLIPAFTFAATAEVVAWLGATALFVDVLPDSFNMDPASLAVGIDTAKRLGLRPVGVITVDLYGQPADYDRLLPIAADAGLWVMCDAAQSFGAHYRERAVGTIGDVTATSFYPAKPLGCYGDGGALFLDDDGLAAVMRSLRVHGEGEHKYDNVRVGMNGRMDTLQAAVLLEKLRVFPDEIAARARAAATYGALLGGIVRTPALGAGNTSVWAQYTIRVPERDLVAARLKELGVPTAIHYPKPLHRQPAYAHHPQAGNGLPVAETLAAEVLSLPMHADLDDAMITRVAEAVRQAVAKR